MVTSIDLNADVGEDCDHDAGLLRIVSSANIATGAHAGGGEVLAATVRMAVAEGCAIGAHPSYADRPNFGRTSHAHEVSTVALQADLLEQILVVADECTRHGTRLTHVKAHGALYHDAAVDEGSARAMAGAVRAAADRLSIDGLCVLGLPDSVLSRVVVESGGRFVAEAFADRLYDSDGRLVPRSAPGAVHLSTELICEQAVGIAVHESVSTTGGTSVAVFADSLCLHGDTPGAVEHARAVRAALEARGVQIRSFRARAT